MLPASFPLRLRIARHAALVASLSGILLPASWIPVAHADVDPSTWVAGGGVAEIVVDGGIVFVAGGFELVGRATGSGVLVSTSNLAPVPGFPPVLGTVSAVAPDGAGGWYVAGAFSHVGGLARQNLAHVTSALTVGEWSPTTDGEVMALTVTATDVVIGGVFASVNGLGRPRLARISRTTGQVSAWTPMPNDRVTSLVHDGTTLYVAGWFSQLGITVRAGLAAFTLATDALTSWHPAATSFSIQLQMHSLALANGYIYVAGNFNAIGGQSWASVAALLPGSGNATGWHVFNSNAVNRILPFGDRVITGGLHGLVAADTATGAVFPNWAPQIFAPQGSVVQVHALESVGSRVAVGGVFGGPSLTHRYFAMYDTAAGAASIPVPEPTQAVRTLVRDGGQLFVGGSFSAYDGVRRSNLAAFDVVTGLPANWAPDATEPSNFGGLGFVTRLAADADRVYAIVSFNDQMSGLPRTQVRAFSRANGGLVWEKECDQIVNAIAYHQNRVYAGGGFTFLGGAKTNLAALDAATGALQPWAPAPDGAVSSLLPVPAALVIGGSFASVMGQPRQRLAQVDYVTGVPTSWSPGADGTVAALTASGNTLYVGGNFLNIGGQPRARVAALDLASDAALAWNPGADGSVNALATDGTDVFAGGSFLTFAGQPATRFAGVTAASGAPLGWGASPNASVNALALANSHVFLGGFYGAIGTDPRSGLASVFDPARLEVEAPPPAASPLRLTVGPSPMREAGHVRFALEREASVSLRVLDVAGRLVRTLVAGERRPAGPHRIALDGAGLSPGVYHVQLRVDAEQSTARFVVLP